MQNEPNFGKAQMNVNKVLIKDYENKSNWTLGENEPNTNPKRTQSPSAIRNTQYEIRDTNPIKANSNPMLVRHQCGGSKAKNAAEFDD